LVGPSAGAMNLRIYSPKERLAIYERLAVESGIGAPVKVYHFQSDTVDFLTSGEVEGRAHRNDVGFVIGLRRDLCGRELKTFAHELAHVILGHCAKAATQAELDAGDVLIAQTLKGETTASEQKAYNERERQTDARAAQTLEAWSVRGIEW